MTESITRREFVSRTALTASALALGCRESGGTQPEPSEKQIDHIIVVTMENRSFDHLLGWVPGADGRQGGISYADRDGTVHSTFRFPDSDSCTYADPNHSYEGARQAHNSGACDGWLRTDGNDIYAISYYIAQDLPFLGKAATEWLVLDRYFCPVMGPTYPNRLVSLAAQTDRLSNTQVASTLPTIWDRLAAANLSGRNYGMGLTSSHLWGTKYLSLIKPIGDFYTDAAAGTLPNVAFVDPQFESDTGNSYHPPGDIRNAEAFLGSVYKAVTTGPLWKKSLLVITFDEWGGFFDHVPPPLAQIPQAERDLGNDGLRGFRVPTVIISPFVKRKTVSSKVYDHSSILRMIESRWNLQPLTVRDSTANNLMDELDFGIAVSPAPVIDVAAGPFGNGCT